jgi:hypothetical protein
MSVALVEVLMLGCLVLLGRASGCRIPTSCWPPLRGGWRRQEAPTSASHAAQQHSSRQPTETINSSCQGLYSSSPDHYLGMMTDYRSGKNRILLIQIEDVSSRSSVKDFQVIGEAFFFVRPDPD